ncbi:MAG: TolC family protein [Myxococcales bacterium]
MSRKSQIAALLLTLSSGGAAQRVHAQDSVTGKPLFEADVVRLTAEHNPQLKVALLQADSARWDALGLEAQYATVIAVDASATQTRTPMVSRAISTSATSTTPTTPSMDMNAAQAVNPYASFTKGTPILAISGQRRADAGAELRKHTLWGADITLRVAPSVIQTFTDKRIFSSNVPGWSSPQYGGLVKLSLKQPLIRGRGRAVNEAQLLQARVQRDNQEYSRDRVASEVLRDALTAYWELWYAGNSVAIEEQSRETALKQRDEAAARAATGSLAPVEVLAFDTQVATRDEAILNARLAYKQRELELLQKLGTIGEVPLGALRAESEPVASLPARDVSERAAMAESAELKGLFSSLQLAQLQEQTATNQYRAKLDFDTYIQAQGMLYNPPGSDPWLSQFNAVSGYVGLSFEAPVNRRRERAEGNKARLATEVAEQNLREGKQRIVAQIGSLHEKGRSGEEAVALAERTLGIAKQQLAAEQARYATGTSTAIQVLEAEDKVRNAQLRVARLRADFIESVLSIEHYTGQLLARYVGVTGD